MKLFQKRARDELVNTSDSGVGSVNGRWTNIKHSILKAAEKVLGKETRVARKPWIDKETLKLMDERRRYKNARDKQGKTQYKRLRNEVQRRCIKARNNWIKGKSKEVETLFKIGKVDAACRKIRENFRERN